MNETETTATNTVTEANTDTTKTAETAANTVSNDTSSTSISRWKSWPMWLGIFGAVWTLLSALGVPAKIGLTNDAYNTALGSIGSILILAGAVNNPTTAGLSTTD